MHAARWKLLIAPLCLALWNGSGCASADLTARSVGHHSRPQATEADGGLAMSVRGAAPLPRQQTDLAPEALATGWAAEARTDRISPAVPTLYVSGPGHAPLMDPCSPCALSWEEDKARFLPEFWCDVESLFTHENALILLVAGGASFAMHETIDHDVEENTARHLHRWGNGQDFFGAIGNPGHHFAFVSGLYAYSLANNDVGAHELSKTLFNALAITGLSTVALKVAANTTVPNAQTGDGGGWPSGHTSSSFAFAAVLDEYYGHAVGIPAYILAGLVGWERIDDREHDLSDVVFGAALGYVIGRTVAAEHHARFCGMELQPYADPATGATGISLERRY